MYGADFIFLIVGIVLLVINICIVVKFFQIASNIEKLTKLYVDGVKTITDDKLKGYYNYAERYFKLPLEEISKEQNDKDYEDFINKTNKNRSNMIKNEIKSMGITKPYNTNH